MTSNNLGQFLKPPSPIVSLFRPKALVLSSQNPWLTHLPKAVTSIMNDPSVVQTYLEDWSHNSESNISTLKRVIFFEVIKTANVTFEILFR